MLAVALDLRSAADLTAFGGKGIYDEGNSEIRGKQLNALADSESGERANADLARAFSAINQLPCEAKTELVAGGKFAPGVYCVSSARLTDELILDAGGDAQEIFVFVVKGDLQAKSDLKMSLTGEARAENIFFVTNGAAAQGGNCSFVEGTFIVGSNVTITEQATPLDTIPNVPPGGIRVSRIRTSSTQALSSDLTNRTVSLAARIQETRAEFTNFVFRSTLLKICKIGGPGIAIGRQFAFDVVINDENGLFPNLTVPPVVVPA